MPNSANFLHSGGMGDIIYSLPFVRDLGGGTLYVKPRNCFNTSADAYLNLKPLLERQPYIRELKRYKPEYSFFQYDPSIEIHFDLDVFRSVPGFDHRPFPLTYFEAYSHPAPPDWRKPWIEVEPKKPPGVEGPFALINRTARYSAGLDWKSIVASINVPFLFIGLSSEHARFEEEIGQKIPFLETQDLSMAAGYIASCKRLYCNQSVCAAIAQGMGVGCSIEVAPTQTCCILGDPNEKVLNASAR